MAGNIYLVGFMGTGKTTVGKKIAEKTGRTFVDLDAMIEAEMGMTIAECFDTKSEEFFRNAESAVLADVTGGDNLVVSTGGGVVLNGANIEKMKETGTMVALMASAEEIHHRTKNSKHRPLLNVGDPLDTIKRMLFERAPLYILADVIVETTGLTADEAAADVLEECGE